MRRGGGRGGGGRGLAGRERGPPPAAQRAGVRGDRPDLRQLDAGRTAAEPAGPAGDPAERETAGAAEAGGVAAFPPAPLSPRRGFPGGPPHSVRKTDQGATLVEYGSLAWRSINAIRVLSVDAVQNAKSDHPGTPMALAPLSGLPCTRTLRNNPKNPDWPRGDP